MLASADVSVSSITCCLQSGIYGTHPNHKRVGLVQ